jgi:hypothetical protein
VRSFTIVDDLIRKDGVGLSATQRKTYIAIAWPEN